MIKIAGIVLIVLGILALVYQGFTYTETKQDAQIGSLKIQHNEIDNINYKIYKVLSISRKLSIQ